MPPLGIVNAYGGMTAKYYSVFVLYLAVWTVLNSFFFAASLPTLNPCNPKVPAPSFTPLTVRGAWNDRITLVVLPPHEYPDWDFTHYLVEAHWQRQRDAESCNANKSLETIVVFRFCTRMLVELLPDHRAHLFEHGSRVSWEWQTPRYRRAYNAFCRRIYGDRRIPYGEQEEVPRFYAI
ncbi:uncharacterized protein BP01DRAFT_378939 [Aspergillus saccharolyticus JOP 1030-1]|uniref:Uncharacterized protein n=1 Tax=Aspergillus saccharolyticus JOP 1030-1 TaxID=1450539 RepID=A0A318ZYJ7_9EURO|nr:hypothetical protein BP01DRAFT_378939 [Aspergillus saccharolyticus JOP 1030-1]PYH49373.1 hypothetical protein BP01DRAFT_378939 [Aspergillus saccharolyticus JOP 1030-1]